MMRLRGFAPLALAIFIGPTIAGQVANDPNRKPAPTTGTPTAPIMINQGTVENNSDVQDPNITYDDGVRLSDGTVLLFNRKTNQVDKYDYTQLGNDYVTRESALSTPSELRTINGLGDNALHIRNKWNFAGKEFGYSCWNNRTQTIGSQSTTLPPMQFRNRVDCSYRVKNQDGTCSPADTDFTCSGPDQYDQATQIGSAKPQSDPYCKGATPAPVCVLAPDPSSGPDCKIDNSTTWGTSGYMCTASSGSYQSLPSGKCTTIRDSNGNATPVCCDAGQLHGQDANGYPTTVPPSCTASCLAKNVSWLSNGNTCSGPAPQTISGASTSVSSTNGNTGTATAACSQGAFTTTGTCTSSSTASATCGVRPTDVSSNLLHTCATMSDGSARCWGRGALSGGLYSYSYLPKTVPGLSGVSSIATYETYNKNCAVTSAGDVQCWVDFDQPPSSLGVTNAKQVVVGMEHMCILLADGTVSCSGSNTQGQLGIGYNNSTNSSGKPAGLSGIVQLTANDFSTCALSNKGIVSCWGANSEGEIGLGISGSIVYTPTVVPGLTGVTQIGSGARHNCAVSSNGSLQCWGYNSYGQLGDGTTTTRTSPTAVPGISNVKQVASTSFYDNGYRQFENQQTCATLADGTAMCWGNNTSGSVPAKVQGLSNVVKIAPGVFHECALISGGTVQCLGDNGLGELGDGNGGPGQSSSTPVTAALTAQNCPCASGPVSWLDSGGNGNQCGTQVNSLPSGGSATVSSTNGNAGTATATCANGILSASGSCASGACPAQTTSWTNGAYTCSGQAPITNNGASSSVPSNNGNVGTGTATCNSGNLTTTGDCSPPPAPNCPANKYPSYYTGGTVYWKDSSGNAVCYPDSDVPATASGSTIYVTDNTNDTTSQATGSAAFYCDQGTWVNRNSNCAVGTPQCTPTQANGVTCANSQGTTWNWPGGGANCGQTLTKGPLASGESVTLYDTNSNPEIYNGTSGTGTGQATVSCHSNGLVYLECGYTCANTSTSDCPAATVSWSYNGYQCSGNIGALQNGTYTAVTSNNGNPGTGTSSCSNGSISTSGTCSPSNVGSQVCGSQNVLWQGADGSGCSGTTTAGQQNSTTSVTAHNSNSTGTATFYCDQENWRYSSGNCNYITPAPSPTACSAQTVYWGDAGCSGPAPVGTQGSSAAVTSTANGTSGSATFTCDRTTWNYSGGSCSAVVQTKPCYNSLGVVIQCAP